MVGARLVLLVLPSLLVGCGSKTDPCLAARKAAIDAVDRAEHAARTEYDVLDSAAEESPMKRTQLELSRIAFNEKLEALEEAMSCLDHEDCCVRVGKLPPTERGGIISLARDLMAHSPIPPALLEVLSPAAKLMDRVLNSTTASEVTDWCMQIRGEMSRVRVVGREEWRKMEDAADAEEESSNAAMAAVQKRLDALQTWRNAIAAKNKPSPTPDPTLLDDARAAVSTYTAACTQ